jgi:hypothetical protein
MSDPIDILREPFDPKVVKWRVGPTNKEKTKGRALAYVDARDVMERLDAAFGPFGWYDQYLVLDGGAVEGTITVREPQYTHKTDVGYSNDPGTDKEVEPLKAAYSDAFKRAAVKWGIGRDLYEMPDFWIALDDSGRYFRGPLPVYVAGAGWQLPGSGSTTAAAGPSSSNPTTPPPPSSPLPDGELSITEPQRRRIKAALTSAKVNGQSLTGDQARALVQIATGKRSTSDLTSEEASTFIEQLADQRFLDSVSEVQAVG